MPTHLLACLITLAQYTPPDCRAADLDRFPPASVAAAGLRATRARLDWLQYHRPVLECDWCAWHEELQYARWRYDCLDWLHAAHGEQGPAYQPVPSLRRLRELIGEEAWFAGQMP